MTKSRFAAEVICFVIAEVAVVGAISIAYYDIMRWWFPLAVVAFVYLQVRACELMSEYYYKNTMRGRIELIKAELSNKIKDASDENQDRLLEVALKTRDAVDVAEDAQLKADDAQGDIAVLMDENKDLARQLAYMTANYDKLSIEFKQFFDDVNDRLGDTTALEALLDKVIEERFNEMLAIMAHKSDSEIRTSIDNVSGQDEVLIKDGE